MRIIKLDGLRGLFSFMVFIFHYPDEYLPNWIHGNFIVENSDSFVDFFFVLSGFVIAFNYFKLSSVTDFLTYIKKRIYRLYPLLFVSVLILMLYKIGYVFITRFYLLEIYPTLFESSSPYNIDLHFFKPIRQSIDSLLMINSTPLMGDSPLDLGMNGPTWSISSELISYVFFGLICLLFKQYRRTMIFCLGIVLSGILLYKKGEYFLSGDFGFLRGLYSFLIGCLVYSFYSGKKYNRSLIIEFATIFLLFILFILLEETRPGLDYFFPLLTPLFFGVIITLLLRTNGFFSKLLETKTLQFLGKISYSIYLNHMLILIILLKPISFILPIKHDAYFQVLAFIIISIILIIFSKITYNTIELKGSHYLKKKIDRLF